MRHVDEVLFGRSSRRTHRLIRDVPHRSWTGTWRTMRFDANPVAICLLRIATLCYALRTELLRTCYIQLHLAFDPRYHSSMIEAA